jgi:hypothetical protein
VHKLVMAGRHGNWNLTIEACADRRRSGCFSGPILPAKRKRFWVVVRLTLPCRAFLLRSKCLHRMDGGGAASGNHGRDQAGGRGQCTDGPDCDWVVSADTKVKCLNGARGEPRGNEPGDKTKCKQERGLLEQ